MNKLLKYLLDKREFYIFAFFVIGTFYLILYLYRALNEAIVYAVILSLSILLVYFIYDFYRYVRKTRQLEHMHHQNYIHAEDLPLYTNNIEKQYQDLMIKINQLHEELESKHENDYRETVDYFTLWVHQVKVPISALRLLIQSHELSQNDLLIQVLKIEQYVDMALNYMKMSHMSSDLRIQTYDLKKMLNNVIKKQATFFIQKKIQLRMDTIDMQILTDEKWMSFVLEQILSNALKYTKEGYISIYVKDEILYIEDSGIGIKKEDLPRVFEKGFTGYNGRLDKKASGLGLYLCKSIIDNLGYRIDIHSQLGKGTIVSIDLHVDKLCVE